MAISPKFVSIGGGKAALEVDALKLEGGSTTNNVPVFDPTINAFKASPADLLGGSGRDQWPAVLFGNTTASPLEIARIPWVPSDNPNATQKNLHLRAVLKVSDPAQTARILVYSVNTGLELTIYNAPGNTFATNSIDSVIVESNVDLFTTPIEVFNPNVVDMLILSLRASGDASATCHYAEFLLVNPPSP